jgi:type IV secretory pathway VirB10-like protein
MEISKAAVGFLVGACVAAGAGGVYMANRDASRPAVAAQQADDAAASFTPSPVEQSEGVVTEAPAPVVTPPIAPAAAPRATTTPRPRAATGPSRAEQAPDTRAAAPAVDAAAPVIADEGPAPAPFEPPRIDDNQASRAVAPAGPLYDELVVAADSVIGLEIESSITSERARVEDPVAARVTRDVRVGDRVAIPAGSRVQGEVTLVERGGRLKERARLGVRFISIVLADGTRLPIETDTIFREGDSPTTESAAKIGGAAIGGAILGGILGGAKGAAIGGAVGAGGGTGVVMAGGRNAATLPSGTPVTVRVQDPVIVTVER